MKRRISGHAQLNATLFRSNNRDDIVTGPALFLGRNTFVNADLTRREGAELLHRRRCSTPRSRWTSPTPTRARVSRTSSASPASIFPATTSPGSKSRLPVARLAARSVRLYHRPGGALADEVFVDDLNGASADSYVVAMARRLSPGRARGAGGVRAHRQYCRPGDVVRDRELQRTRGISSRHRIAPTRSLSPPASHLAKLLSGRRRRARSPGRITKESTERSCPDCRRLP